MPQPAGSQRSPTPISVEIADGFTVYRNSASPDLWPLVRVFREKSVRGEALPAGNPEHQVHLIEYAGKRYVVKRVAQRRLRWEKALQTLVYGPFLPRLMRKVLAARKNGCTVVADMHLVAERRAKGRGTETFAVMDYVEGASVANGAECRERQEQVVAAMNELHRHRLALGDVNHKNFIVGANGVAIVDLSSGCAFRLGKIKDVVRMRMFYGIRLPVMGVVDWALFVPTYLHLQLYYRLRLLRKAGKTNPLRGGKKW